MDESAQQPLPSRKSPQIARITTSNKHVRINDRIHSNCLLAIGARFFAKKIVERGGGHLRRVVVVVIRLL